MKLLSVVTALAIAVPCVYLHAQTSAGRGTRIEYTGPFGAMSATIQATLIAGQKSTPLFFEDSTAHPMMPTFITKPFVVTPTSRITGEVVSFVRVTAFPTGPTRFAEVDWRVGLEIVDAATGKKLGKGINTGAWYSTTQPVDTMLGRSFKTNLSEFSGRKVYLRMRIIVEPEMLEGQQVSIVDITTPQKTNIH